MTEYISPMIIKQIRELYDVAKNEHGEIEFLIKGQNTLPVTKTGDRFLKPQEIIKSFLENANVLKVSNATPEKPYATKGTPQNPEPVRQVTGRGNQRMPEHYYKAMERLKQIESSTR
jgi:hypothetical protein